MALPPQIHTYHCLCTSLLLASTHILSTLPRRDGSSESNEVRGEGSLILPLPSLPPDLAPVDAINSNSNSDSEDEANTLTNTHEKGKGKAPATDTEPTIPPQGYTILLSLLPDRSTTIIRREDGFEKRILYRCGRCRIVVGYELLGGGGGGGGDAMEIDGKVDDVYKGKVVYLLPGGIMSTDVMARGGVVKDGGQKIEEGDVEILGGRVVVFE